MVSVLGWRTPKHAIASSSEFTTKIGTPRSSRNRFFPWSRLAALPGNGLLISTSVSPTSSAVPEPKYICRINPSIGLRIGAMALIKVARRPADWDAPWAITRSTLRPDIGSIPSTARFGPMSSAACEKMSKERSSEGMCKSGYRSASQPCSP